MWCLSTMRRFVEAMGGELEIRARFPEGVVDRRDSGGVGRCRRVGTTAAKWGWDVTVVPAAAGRR